MKRNHPKSFNNHQTHPISEDGSDPRKFFRKSSTTSSDRKVLQLCSQVQEALYWVLGAECGDESLGLMSVVAVEPAPDSSRLLVTIAVPADIPLEDAVVSLSEAAKALRSEVAGAIYRRKAPELIYHPIHMG